MKCKKIVNSKNNVEGQKRNGRNVKLVKTGNTIIIKHCKLISNTISRTAELNFIQTRSLNLKTTKKCFLQQKLPDFGSNSTIANKFNEYVIDQIIKIQEDITKTASVTSINVVREQL